MKLAHSSKALFIDGHALSHVHCGVEYEVTRYSKKYGYSILDAKGKEVLISWTMFSKFSFRVIP
jgi:hypothetical protein